MRGLCAGLEDDGKLGSVLEAIEESCKKRQAVFDVMGEDRSTKPTTIKQL